VNVYLRGHLALGLFSFEVGRWNGRQVKKFAIIPTGDEIMSITKSISVSLQRQGWITYTHARWHYDCPKVSF